jgi:hypothetical protein
MPRWSGEQYFIVAQRKTIPVDDFDAWLLDQASALRENVRGPQIRS